MIPKWVPAQIISAWEDGLITESEVMSALIDILTEYNINDVVCALPDRWRTLFVAHLREWGSYDGKEPLVVINQGTWGSGTEPEISDRERMRQTHSEQQTAKTAHLVNVVLPAIRTWLALQSSCMTRS